MTLLHARILRAEEELERLNTEYSAVWEAAKAVEDPSVSLTGLIDRLPAASDTEDELLTAEILDEAVIEEAAKLESGDARKREIAIIDVD